MRSDSIFTFSSELFPLKYNFTTNIVFRKILTLPTEPQWPVWRLIQSETLLDRHNTYIRYFSVFQTFKFVNLEEKLNKFDYRNRKLPIWECPNLEKTGQTLSNFPQNFPFPSNLSFKAFSIHQKEISTIQKF